MTLVGFGGIPIRDRPYDEALRLVEKAVERGIDFFDTARSYGDSERKIGRAIGRMPGIRSSVVLATKSMERSKTGMMRDIETSLRTMGCEYIDIYQAHGVDSEESLQAILARDGAISALRRAQSLGLVLHVGITGHNPWVLRKAIATGEFDTVQVPVNALDRLIFRPEEVVLPEACALDIGVIAMKPLAGGALKPAEHALRYSISQAISVAIPGIGSMEELEAALNAAANPAPLSTEELDALIAGARALGPDICRQCGYCMPCPQEINIREIFRLLAMYQRYEQKTQARQSYEGILPKADQCVQCGACEERCPYKLEIRKKLAYAHSVLG